MKLKEFCEYLAEKFKVDYKRYKLDFKQLNGYSLIINGEDNKPFQIMVKIRQKGLKYRKVYIELYYHFKEYNFFKAEALEKFENIPEGIKDIIKEIFLYEENI